MDIDATINLRAYKTNCRVYIHNYIYCFLFTFKELRLSATECLQHSWLKTPQDRQYKDLETVYLRKYLARRRWRRWFNAIVAMNRMISNGIFAKNNVGDVVLKEGMFGDYGELGFFV